METFCGSIAGVVGHVEVIGGRRAGRLAVAAWAAAEPALAGFATAGDVAAACRSGSPQVQDAIVGALVRVGAGDELAQLTAVAGLSRRLVRVVAGWRRAGVGGDELAAMEAELVGGCWAAIAAADSNGARLGLRLVDAAHNAVRLPRRRLRRAACRLVPLEASTGAASVVGRPAAERLAMAVTDAVRGGLLSVTDARCVYLTRVAGLPVGEVSARLGCTPGVVRARRSRAERRLAAA